MGRQGEWFGGQTRPYSVVGVSVDMYNFLAVDRRALVDL